MRVPEQAASGKAKIVLSFATWKDGNVRPATVEAPVAAPTAKKP